MTGPRRECFAVMCTHMLWLSVLLLWTFSLVPYLVQKSPDWGLVVSSIGWALLAIIYVALLRAQYMDPGVLFREIIYDEDRQNLYGKRDNNDLIYKGAHIYK